MRTERQYIAKIAVCLCEGIFCRLATPVVDLKCIGEIVHREQLTPNSYFILSCGDGKNNKRLQFYWPPAF